MKNQTSIIFSLCLTILFLGKNLIGQSTYILDKHNNHISVFDAKTSTIQEVFTPPYPDLHWTDVELSPSGESLLVLGRQGFYGQFVIDQLNTETGQFSPGTFEITDAILYELYMGPNDKNFVLVRDGQGYFIQQVNLETGLTEFKYPLLTETQPEPIHQASQSTFYFLPDELTEIQAFVYTELPEIGEFSIGIEKAPTNLAAFFNLEDPDKSGKLYLSPDEKTLFFLTLAPDETGLLQVRLFAIDASGNTPRPPTVEKASWTMEGYYSIQDFKVSIDNNTAYVLANSSFGLGSQAFKIDLVDQTPVSETFYPGLMLEGILLDPTEKDKAFLLDKVASALLPINTAYGMEFDGRSEIGLPLNDNLQLSSVDKRFKTINTAQSTAISSATTPQIGLITTTSDWRTLADTSFQQTSSILAFNSDSDQLYQSQAFLGKPSGVAINPATNEYYVYNAEFNLLHIFDGPTQIEKNAIALGESLPPLRLLGLNAGQNQLFFWEQRRYSEASILRTLAWDAANPGANTTFVSHSIPVDNKLYFNDSGSRMVIFPSIFQETPTIKIYDCSGATLDLDQPMQTITLKDADFGRVEGYGAWLIGAAISPDDKMLYAWDTKGSIVRYSIEDASFDGGLSFTGYFSELCFSKDGQTLFGIDPWGLTTFEVEGFRAKNYYNLDKYSGLDKMEITEDGKSIYLYDQAEYKTPGVFDIDSIGENPNRATVLVFDPQENKMKDQLFPGGNVVDLVLPAFQEQADESTYTPVVIDDPGIAYLPDSKSHNVAVIDLETELTIGIVPLPNGAAPTSVAVSPDGKFVYVGSSTKTEVYVIQTATNRHIQTLYTSGQPISLATDPITKVLMILSENGDDSGMVEYFSYLDHAPRNRIDVAGKPGIISSGYNTMACLMDMDKEAGKVLIFKDGASSPQQINIGKNASALQVSPDGKFILVCDLDAEDNEQRLAVIAHEGTPTIINQVLLYGAGQDIVFNHAGDKIFITPDNSFIHSFAAEDLLIASSVREEAERYWLDFEGDRGLAISPDDKKIIRIGGSQAEFYPSEDIILRTGGQDGGNELGTSTWIGTKGETQDLVVVPSSNLSPILLDRDPHAFITVSGENKVSVINTVSQQVVKEIPVGEFPEGVTVDPKRKKVYVTNFNSNSVSVIDQATGVVDITIPVGEKPLGIVADPVGGLVYVANVGGNSISVINPNNYEYKLTIPDVQTPYGLCLEPQSSTLFASNYNTGEVTLINLSNNTVTSSIPVGEEPCGIAAHPNKPEIYVANHKSNSISVIDLASAGLPTKTIPVGKDPLGLSFSPDGKELYVTHEEFGKVEIISTETYTKLDKTLDAGIFQRGLSKTPDGKTTFVVKSEEDLVRVFNNETQAETTTIPVGDDPEAFGNFITPGQTTSYVRVDQPGGYVNNSKHPISIADWDAALPGPSLIQTEIDNPFGFTLGQNGNYVYFFTRKMRRDNRGLYSTLWKLDVNTHEITYGGSFFGDHLAISEDASLVAKASIPYFELEDIGKTGSTDIEIRYDRELGGLVISPNHKYIAATSKHSSNTFYLFYASGYKAKTFHRVDLFWGGVNGKVSSLSFDPSGNHILIHLAGVHDEGMPIYDAYEARKVGSIYFGTDEHKNRSIYPFTFSPDGNTLYYAESNSEDERILYSLDVSEGLKRDIDIDENLSLRKSYGEIGRMQCLKASPDGKTLYIYPLDEPNLIVMDLVSGEIVRRVPLGGDPQGCGCVRVQN